MDSSDNFEIIGVLMLRSKDKEAWLRAFRDKKLHLRELKRADKRRISGRMLSLLRDGWKESHGNAPSEPICGPGGLLRLNPGTGMICCGATMAA